MTKALKMLAVLLPAVSMMAFAGCTKDYEKEVLGSWQLTEGYCSSVYEGNCVSYLTPGEPMVNDLTPREGESYVLSFFEDGSFSLKEDLPDRFDQMQGSYCVKGDKLTASLENRTRTYTIEEVDGNSMVLFYVERESYSEDGKEVTLVTNVKMTFKRV